MKIAGVHVVFHRLLKTSKKHAVCAVLLCKRTQDAPMHPGYWSLFGGMLEPGEQPRKAAGREIQEELGIALAQGKLKSLVDVKVQRGIRRGVLGARYFSAVLDIDMDNLKLKRNDHDDKVEGEGLGWFTAEEIHHLNVRPEDRIAIHVFFSKYGT